eukprot:455397-Pyramimonas_sp.AAC.1
MLHDGKAINAEQMHRHRSQLSVLGGLRRAVFKKNNDLELGPKIKFAAVFCHSRVMFHGAVWAPLSTSNQSFLESAYLTCLRAAMGYKVQGGEFRAWSKDEVHVVSKRLSPLTVLRFRRLRFLQRLVGFASNGLLFMLGCMIDAKGSWAELMQDD